MSCFPRPGTGDQLGAAGGLPTFQPRPTEVNRALVVLKAAIGDSSLLKSRAATA